MHLILISVLIIILIVTSVLKIGGELIQLSSNEILSAENFFFEKVFSKISFFFNVEDHMIIDIDLRQIGGSSLTDDMDVPKERKEQEMAEGNVK